jgi:hypothetical protein
MRIPTTTVEFAHAEDIANDGTGKSLPNQVVVHRRADSDSDSDSDSDLNALGSGYVHECLSLNILPRSCLSPSMLLRRETAIEAAGHEY